MGLFWIYPTLLAVLAVCEVDSASSLSPVIDVGNFRAEAVNQNMGGPGGGVVRLGVVTNIRLCTVAGTASYQSEFAAENYENP